jgi:GntR family transcriptional regulator / MocR family aminotransferase
MRRKAGPLLTLPPGNGILYVRLYQRMRALILEGSWPPGMRLPSSRTLAADLDISRNTASLALDQLLADGWIETRSRAGAFVGGNLKLGRAPAARHLHSRPGTPPVPFELAQGAVDAFPFDQWSKLQSRVWAQSVPHLLYQSDPAGDAGLRQAIASIVAPARGLSCDPADVIVVTSTQSAFDLTAAAAGGAGMQIVVEDPGYVPGHAAFTARGMEVVPVPVDEEGLDVDMARRLVPSPSLILTTPAAQFPTCVRMSDARRLALLAWAEQCGAWVIEDDYDSDARFDGVPAAAPLKQADAAGRVVTIVSFNRLLFRSLRLGFMIVPPALRAPMLSALEAVDGFVNLPNQLVLRAFIEEGSFFSHQRRSRQLHRERRDALMALLQPYAGRLFEPIRNDAGLHLILRPIGIPAPVLADALRGAGISCTTLSDLSVSPVSCDAVLLGFAAFAPDVTEAMRPALEDALNGL